VVAGSRREARERALELLYEAEVRGEPVSVVLAAQTMKPDPFAEQLVLGVESTEAALDAQISALAVDWTTDRMPVLDLAILRMSLFELSALSTPTAVVISEAVELAKRYSTEGSSRFVNGVLAAACRLQE
jgi:N utilization substance protein B